MNALAEENANGGGLEITLRPEQPEDEGFLFAVYAGTRAEELALTNWDEPTRRAFLAHQFNAMRLGYRGMFPEGEFSIICADGRPVGRMVINRSVTEICVVDVALLPEQRGRGAGTLLMRRVCAEAEIAGKPVRLSVLKNNPAGQWYARLGFIRVADHGIYDELEWRSTGVVNGKSPTG